MTAHARWNPVDGRRMTGAPVAPPRTLDARLEHRLVTRSAADLAFLIELDRGGPRRDGVRRSTASETDAFDGGYGHGV